MKREEQEGTVTKSYKRIAALNTALDIVEHLADQTRPVTAKEIADALKLPYGTAMSHIATLVDRGYIGQKGDGLQIGVKMAGHWYRFKAEIDSKRAKFDQAASLLGEL